MHERQAKWEQAAPSTKKLDLACALSLLEDAMDSRDLSVNSPSKPVTDEVVGVLELDGKPAVEGGATADEAGEWLVFFFCCAT